MLIFMFFTKRTLCLFQRERVEDERDEREKVEDERDERERER